MMQQNIPTLNFDTYFNVISNPNPSTLYHEQHQTQRHMPMSQRFSANNQHNYYSQSEQNNPQMLNWYLKQQQQPMQLSLNTSPMSTEDSHVVSPNQLSPRSDYFFPVTQSSSVCSTPSESTPQFETPVSPFGSAKQRMQRPYHIDCYSPQEPQLNFAFGGSSPVHSVDSNGLQTPVSEHVFPEAPQSHVGMSSPQSPSVVSSPTAVLPLRETPPLSNAFATIDQWRNQDYDERNQWDIKSDDFSSASQIGRSPHVNIENGRQLKKVAHNAIERRYRNNINDCIHELKNVVPALYKAKIKGKSSSDDFDDDDDDDEGDDEPKIVDGVEIAKKLNKATILHKATQYILHLKYVNSLAEKENQVLQQIISQMPDGDKVLNHFLNQKVGFQQSEQHRLAHERKLNSEREKIERQRILRERAAQRAALAELLPKQGRRPYRRRAKKNTSSVAGDKDNKNK
ncbi:HLH-domain-containing protein [Backusella circina FSU 941]|nr:HLH-domain-containing protein [Backusella circina FSU 941]